MKKRMFVYLLIFAVCFSQLAAVPVLANNHEFTFTLPAIGVNQFVVIAKSNMKAEHGIHAADQIATLVGIRAIGPAWHDLGARLANGDNIDLSGPKGTEEGDLVISEVMWGHDASLGDSTANQWIELYNTKESTIPTGAWTLTFSTPAAPAEKTATFSDRLSTSSPISGIWAGDLPGSSGDSTDPQKTITSMLRNIDYDTVQDSEVERARQLEAVPAGTESGSWKASERPSHGIDNRIATPGSRAFVQQLATQPSKTVVFNEIANRSDKKSDWIELYNPGSTEVKLKGWVLSKVTGVNKDEKLVQFDSAVIPAKGFLLVVNTNPVRTVLRAKGVPHTYVDDPKLDIPNENYLLVLRDKENLGSHENIVDIAGHLGDLNLEPGGGATLWPLRGDLGSVPEDDLTESDDNTWVRDRDKEYQSIDAWKLEGGETGVGIIPNPSDKDLTSGTPGFDNDAVKNKVTDLDLRDPVIISEIMFGRGDDQLPQWIELFNPSKTQAVNLHNWSLEVHNVRTSEERLEPDYTLTLLPVDFPDGLIIQPYETVLIVSYFVRVKTEMGFPDNQTVDISLTDSLTDSARVANERDAILSSIGFYIKLSDPDGEVVDQAGNIDSDPRTDDEPAWTLPGGNLEDGGGRASMMRLSDEGKFGDGTEKNEWISADKYDFKASGQRRHPGKGQLYYGDKGDIGTPGYRVGGPLPVQLSSFHSKRNDAGAVIITWSTESELDNAGFNLLRSSSRSGEFTKINAQLIPGAGTTGEKNTYTWTDTSAKPNVVYYYQIEDVSLDGAHRTLRTTRLRGHVGAHGKLTTTWGVLKSRD